MQNCVTRGDIIDGAVIDRVTPMITAGATVISTKDHTQVIATIQILVPTERDMSVLILDKLHRMENQLVLYANNLDYVTKKLSAIQDQSSEISHLVAILHNTVEQAKTKDQFLSNLPPWHSVSAVAKKAKLTSGAVRKQLKNGEFEDGVDFKSDGGRILIHQGAVVRIHRRRSLNG